MFVPPLSRSLFLPYLLVVLTFFLWVSPLGAQTEREELNACLDKAPHTAAMAQCAVKSYKAADQRLNSLYQAVLQNQDAQGKKAFTNAQLAWLKFRDTYCGGFLAGRLSGDSKKYLLHRCLTQLTVERNAHFDELLISP